MQIKKYKGRTAREWHKLHEVMRHDFGRLLRKITRARKVLAVVILLLLIQSADADVDAEKFRTSWMPAVRREAKTLGVTLPRYSARCSGPDDPGGEAMEEWLWLEFFLEHKSPQEAAKAAADYFKEKH